MKITVVSSLTGAEHTREIDLAPNVYHDILWYTTLIQAAMKHLPAEDREFLLTGIMPHEWDEAA